MLLMFDATAERCAVALFDGENMLAERADMMARGHSERLFPLIDDCLAGARRAYADLTAIAVCTGPGNFTGARIGVSAARGLALSLSVPAVGVDRFETAAEDAEGLVCIRLEARGGAAHLAKYHGSVPVAPAETVQAADIEEYIGDLPVIAVQEADLSALARVARRRMAEGAHPRPAPRYLKPANAALPADAPPRIL